MPSTKYDGIALPRGIDPDIAVVLQKMDARLRQLDAGSGPADALAVAGGQVAVGTGPAPIAGQALLATNKRTAKWGTVVQTVWSWERVDLTATGTSLVYECPSALTWLPVCFLVRTRGTSYSVGGTAPVVSFGVTGGAYADVLAATTLSPTTAAQMQTLTPTSPASSVQDGAQVYANISVAAAPGPAMIDVYGVGILVPQ